MLNKSVLLFGLFLTVSCKVNSFDNPERIYIDIDKRYTSAEIEYIDIQSHLDDGMTLAIYDIKHKVSEDNLYQVNMLATMGQTTYWCFEKKNSNSWYIRKELTYYQEPYTLDGAEVQNTYFVIHQGVVYEYNSQTSEFIKISDDDSFSGIVDVAKFSELLKIIRDNTINR